jgi:hypothetical protein
LFRADQVAPADPMSVVGQPRRFSPVGARSAKPPEASRKADMASPEGRAGALPRPSRSDFDLLRYRQSVINIDAQIAHRALNLRVPQQKLNRT